MTTELFIIFIGILILGAHMFNGLFSRIKIPTALILLLIGIVAGPVLKIISAEFMGEFGPVFTTMTLILLLFDSGISLKIKSLIGSFGSAFFLTLFSFIVSTAICTGVALLFIDSLNTMTALFFGVIVGGTSSAIVIPMIRQLKLSSDGETLLTLESALSDVFCLVIGLALLTNLGAETINFSKIGGTIGSSFLFAGLIGIGFGFVWSMLINAIRHIENYFTINLAMLFIVYGLSEHLGFNGGIATLLFGITLANTHLLNIKAFPDRWKPKPLIEKDRSFTSELVFLFSTFFFVYVGLQIQFGNVWVYALVLSMLALLFLIRPFIVKLSVRRSLPIRDFHISSIMIPKGIVPAILATLPMQMGMASEDESLIAAGADIQSLTYAIILVSIILTSLFSSYFAKERNLEFFNKLFPHAGSDLIADSEILPGKSEEKTNSNLSDSKPIEQNSTADATEISTKLSSEKDSEI